MRGQFFAFLDPSSSKKKFCHTSVIFNLISKTIYGLISQANSSLFAGKIFPYVDMFKWLSYGNGKSSSLICNFSFHISFVTLLLWVLQMESIQVVITHTLVEGSFLSHWIMIFTCDFNRLILYLSWKMLSKRSVLSK